MQSTVTVFVPVVCRVCGCPKLREYPAGLVAAALTGGKPLRFHSCCRAASWSASDVELQRIREHLGASGLNAQGPPPIRAAPGNPRGPDAVDDRARA